MTIRQDLVSRLRAYFGAGVHVVPYRDNLDTIERLTVVVKQGEWTRLPEAPAGAFRVEYVVTIIHPAVDAAIAEPALDEIVEAFLANAFPGSSVSAISAEPVLYEPQNMAYDVAVVVITEGKTEE